MSVRTKLILQLFLLVLLLGGVLCRLAGLVSMSTLMLLSGPLLLLLLFLSLSLLRGLSSPAAAFHAGQPSRPETGRVDGEGRPESMDRELCVLVHMVSHDLRNPLSAVLGLGQALQEKAKMAGDENHTALGHIVAGAEKMERIINALLALSQVSSQPLRYDAVDLAACARQAFADRQRRQPKPDAELVAPPELKVAGAPDLLLLAMENLMRNAWKTADPERPLRVELGCRHEDGRDIYYFRDNGLGFVGGEGDDLSGVAADGERANGRMPGIDLAIAARIIRRHEGEVWIDAAEGEGCCFSFRLGLPGLGERG
ncbi:histidine kinase/DNA gyrase B/HSP90-like ATPase [Geothermobacter ehrlichii]|uniref:histidine kinase n=1 Tax=Geothermobacter ehrlichii TaxID=213224 RepID=A0A5D3WJ83_9BACT|nr:HAMP domain-containing sensor histidine kinase [Geothermobacter ehrlichii]TYO98580.1 histidine kinase/DNA gyrase B/HSP90-like ATPase [Geothermobacter ehrlichii]